MITRAVRRAVVSVFMVERSATVTLLACTTARKAISSAAPHNTIGAAGWTSRSCSSYRTCSIRSMRAPAISPRMAFADDLVHSMLDLVCPVFEQVTQHASARFPDCRSPWFW
ncbi:hypothetical protein [Amycolatopsis sp. cmx-11-12]|uniref:hypothetical protein n=1 Tax=Amycolatopsis sp. cmx-11-12 TaxID=2785795 RepID=UPI003917E1BD